MCSKKQQAMQSGSQDAGKLMLLYKEPSSVKKK